MYQVTFQFENGDKPVVFSASPNITLLEAARSANVAIDAPCSGNGSCGKCRVQLPQRRGLTAIRRRTYLRGRICRRLAAELLRARSSAT